MILGDELRAEAIPDLRNLNRIDRIYATARFASQHPYRVLAMGIFLVGGILVMLSVMGYRSWVRRRRQRFNSPPPRNGPGGAGLPA